MKLEWMGEYRDVIEQLIKYCNVYASVYTKERQMGSSVPFSFAQIQIVEYLLENEDLNQNMMTIAGRLGISYSTFSKLASRLVKKGLLQKFHMQGNRKDVIIRVTPAGKKVYDAYVRYIVDLHFGKMFDAAKDIPREVLPLFANMLGAATPASTSPPEPKALVLIPMQKI